MHWAGWWQHIRLQSINWGSTKKPGSTQLQVNYPGKHTLSSRLTNQQSLQWNNKQNVYSTVYSQAVTHPSTNTAQCCLTSVIRRELVFSTWYGRRHLDVAIRLSQLQPHSTHASVSKPRLKQFRLKSTYFHQRWGWFHVNQLSTGPMRALWLPNNS